MAISDLQAKQGKVDLVVEIIEKSEPREFNKFGKAGRVCNAKAKDASGQITLTLWNEQVDQVNVGSTVQVKNGYVSEWQGELQLSTGKFGELEVVSAGQAPAAESSPAPQADDETEEDELEIPEVKEEEVN
ncbi:hypothetical protein HN419_02845 [Candidatus Woesearchaeota archaeon]|jgi:replication factor A1|nr:hypothetical protein [Candidatus Woesearchaeota archaeon]MBT3537064.1 hypothetical protein [Candidatus Woesearchaeota archaeon]MBT4697674.1 hypothetical protein [Candidatus Woesearchaeota archaeon]MBT4716984.1 hypothetical protein [Candidatus Woesearchaeota archaeon]MBT7106626.1 hypothetical protein [Candidatus Woesearchaeota archaeon]